MRVFVATNLSRSNVTVPTPMARHYDVLQGLLESTGVGGNLD